MKLGCKCIAVKDIVAQYQAGTVVTYKVLADNKCLRKTVGRRLLGILEMHAVIRPVAKQAPEAGKILRC